MLILKKEYRLYCAIKKCTQLFRTVIVIRFAVRESIPTEGGGAFSRGADDKIASTSRNLPAGTATACSLSCTKENQSMTRGKGESDASTKHTAMPMSVSPSPANSTGRMRTSTGVAQIDLLRSLQVLRERTIVVEVTNRIDSAWWCEHLVDTSAGSAWGRERWGQMIGGRATADVAPRQGIDRFFHKSASTGTAIVR